MGFSLSTDSYKAYADRNATSFSGYSSVSENFAASVGQVIDEELSISSLLHNEGFSSRNQQIRNMVSDGKIDQELMDMYTTGNPGRGKKVDYNAIAEYLNWSDSLPEKLLTDKELTDERNEELANRRKYRHEVFNTSLTGGKVAQFAGGIVASGLDPVNMATMTLAAPIAGVRNVSKAMYSLKMARNGAALNAGVSIPIEPFIHSWKEEIGAEYTIEDSLFNIVASGVLGGTVSGIGAALGKGLGLDRDSLISKIMKADLDDFATQIKDAPKPTPGPSATKQDFDEIAEIYTSSSTEMRRDSFADVDQLLGMLEDKGIKWVSTDALSNFANTVKAKGAHESMFSGIEDIASTLKSEGIDSIDTEFVRKFIKDIRKKRPISGSFENMSYKRLVNKFKELGADEDDAENLARFIDEANQAPENMNAETFVRKTEESQSGMDAGNKADIEPNFDSEDAAVLKTQFDRPEVAEGEIQLDTREHVPADNMITMEDGTQISFREASAKLDEETEFLISKLDCLNG